MDRLIIETSESPEIIITQINGTLRMKGWDRPQIRADMEHEDTIKADTEGNKVTISCSSGCLLRVPSDSTISIDKVMNELVIKSVDGPIKVKDVHGQIMVKSIGAFSVENAYGALNAKNVEADLVCGRISGQASIQDVDGKISLEQVMGGLNVRGHSTGLQANSMGNANLSLEPETDFEYRVKSNGNISYRMEPYTSAVINMKSNAGKIRLSIPDYQETVPGKEHEIVVGDGDSKIFLEANGNIEIIERREGRGDAEFEFDFEEFGDLTTLADDITQMVTGQIESQMDSISQHINDLTSNLANIDIHTSERTRRTMEAQRRNLERKLASVERRAIQKARIAERRIEQKMRGRTRKPSSDPVSDEERQKVLEMLQNQQISVAEAEFLLASLEGQAPSAAKSKPDSTSQEAAE